MRTLPESSQQSLGALTASSDPLDLLTDRQLLIVVARAHGRAMTRIAAVLGVSREILHRELRVAQRALRQHPRARRREAEEVPAAADPYRCPRHDRDCPPTCGHLRLWLARHP